VIVAPPPGAGPPATGELVDQADRDLIVHGLRRTVFATAGAGSGKTRHLIDRLCNLVTSGDVAIDEIALITFSEAAAAELRDRLAEQLEVLHERAVTTGDAATARRASDALSGLDAAAVTTLHGFARRILAEHPFEAGVPPTFEVLDQAQSLGDLDEHWPALLQGMLEDPPTAKAVQWALVAGARVAALRTIAGRMGDNWDALTRPPAGAAPVPALPALDPSHVLVPLRGALERAASCADGEDHLLQHLERLAPYADDLEGAATEGEELAVLRLLTAPPGRLSSSRGRAQAWGADKAAVANLLAEAEAARVAAVEEALGRAAGAIGAALAAQVVRTARRRQREGRLHFHDLLVLACEVVRQHAGVRAALHRRYRRILVDEFQDTDPLQAELVTMIAAAPDAPVGTAPWWELPTTEGALFFVGDPLQSIYAFRRADVATFLRVEALADRAHASLVTNFRSAPGIVGWVNAVFGVLVGAGTPGTQPAFAPQVPVPPAGPTAAEDRPAPPGAPRPAVPVTVLGAGARRPERAQEAREAEAGELAALLRRMVDEGWAVGEGRRPVAPPDIVVLVPTRASLPALEAALDGEGLAYRLESSSLVYAAAEVQDLLHVLHAIDDPSDDLSVVAALRTPGLACGDDDLLRFRVAGGSWDYTADPPGLPGIPDGDPVRRALATLRRWHAERSWIGVSQLVATVVEELRQLPVALEGPRWREEWRRLRFVMDQARQFSESSPGGLGQYLAWVDVQREEDARVTEVVLPETDTPSLAIMTVHAAKGLEFPVVAVVGFGRELQTVRAPTVLFGDGGFEVGIRGELSTPGYRAARDRASLFEGHEVLRLLYVAVTRAKEHLVVSVHRHEGARRSSQPAVTEQLEQALESAAGLWSRAADVPVAPAVASRAADVPVAPAVASRAAVPATAPGRPPTPSAPEAETGDAATVAAWTLRRALRLDAPPRAVSATSLARLAAGGPGVLPDGPDATGAAGAAGDPLEEVGDEASALRRVRRGRAGTAVGRAVHAVLQTVDLLTREGLDRLAAGEAEAEGVPGRSAEVAALARAALGSELVRGAAAGRHWRELYVGVPVGGRVLEGFVDLLFEGPAGLEVVDYKTDQVADDVEIDRLLRQYRLQGAAYAHAVAASVGRPVRRCTFLFLRPGRGRPEAVARSVDGLDLAVREVLDVVASLPD
jgi:ATP-dependent helicase/nuclease subunit A